MLERPRGQTVGKISMAKDPAPKIYRYQRDGTHTGFPERADIILSLTELKQLFADIVGFLVLWLHPGKPRALSDNFQSSPIRQRTCYAY